MPAVATPARVLTLSLLIAPAALAADQNWTNPGGGLFSDAGNWSGGVPGATDDAVFDLAGESFTVNFSNNAFNNRLLVRNGEITFDLNAYVYIASTTAPTPPSTVIGYGGGDDATLTVLDGQLGSHQSRIGDIANSTGTVNIGADGHWSHQFNLFVGHYGDGSLNVTDGGYVNNVTAYIGAWAGSNGAATVTGTDSAWANGGFLRIGQAGTGTLDVLDGGSVMNGVGLVGVQSGAEGTVTVEGNDSVWINQGGLYVGGDQNAAGGMGTVVVNDGGEVRNISANDSIIWETGTLAGSDGLVNGHVINHGTVTPGRLSGDTTGVLSFDDNFTQSAAGSLEIELGGLASGEWDQLIVNGDVNLDGLLDISLVDNFQLGAEEYFEIIQSNSVSGTFNGLAEGDVVGTFNGIDLHVTYTLDSGAGVAVYTVPAPGGLALVLLAGLRRRRRNA